MTAIGIGWRHPHYEELLREQPSLGFLEVHSENFFGEGGAALAVLEHGRRDYAISLHGVGLALGSAEGVDAWHLDRLQRLVERIEPVRVSDHACFARAQWAGRCVHAADLLPLPFNDSALDALCSNVQRVQDRLKRSLLVENLSSYVEFMGSDRSETEFLSQLATRTGCSLLVDLNNIYVNALNAGMGGSDADPLVSCKRWLDAINPGDVAEIHLAGHCRTPEIVIDDHGSIVADDVWDLYRHAVMRFGDVPALVEWDTGVPALGVLLGEAGKALVIAQQSMQVAA
ncbi:DUF692 domain-containing protein [Caenimonas sp. SL110]|uniref:DUF692 domain-containing protein n=1 Tax=Caenimonas sp. SL110 TaxID=1450524 RepID=UPI00069FA3C8|nr:DUF692 domain-containing protein [Caenimonas sp. SL110]